MLSATSTLTHRTWRSSLFAVHARRINTTSDAANVIDSNNSTTTFTFESLVAAPSTPESVALRLQQYFDKKELNAVSPTLRHQIVYSAAFVHKLAPLLQWAFQHLPVVASNNDSRSSNDNSDGGSPHSLLQPQSHTHLLDPQHRQPPSSSQPSSANTTASPPSSPLSSSSPSSPERDAVATLFVMLTPWTNIARDHIWRSFYMQQFFLAQTAPPLAVFQRALELHESVLPPAPSTKRSARDATFLAADLVLELCARGRFTEAIDAYATLPLSDRTRRDVVQTMHDHEQYASLITLYRTHRTFKLAVAAAPLDAYPLLHALNALKRHDALQREFQQLSPRDQKRADIQALIG